MSTPKLPILVSPEELSNHLHNDWLIIVYVGKEEKYKEGHIPDAVRIYQSDLNYGIAPQVGHLPAVEQLEQLFRGIGMHNRHHIVCYDEDAGTAAARLFWVLEAMGHRQVSFLDGGFLAWSKQGLPINTNMPPIKFGAWQAHPDLDIVATKEYVLHTLDNPDVQILDARSEEEHAGLKSASDRKGHIPGAISMNWLTTRDTEASNRLKPLDALQETLKQRGIDKQKEIIAHCQTHQRSCHSYVMLRALGYEKIRGFAGSWSEWAADPDMPAINQQESQETSG